jgi:hypothetical protein
MRTPVALTVALVLLGSSGCRDEQAGPRPKRSGAPPSLAAQGVRTVDQPPPLTFTSGATWGNGAVVYLGSIVDPPNPRAGDQVTLRHFFRAATQVPAGYRFFLHVVDGASGQQVGNLDHELQQGAAPLGSWPVGKVIEDVHGFSMPSVASALKLRLGFWNDEGRLRPDQPERADSSGRVLGPTLEGTQVALPEYHLPKASKAPVIDGRLDDEAWKAAPAVTLLGSVDGRPVSKKTTVRLLWDEANLYVAFDAEDPDIWGTKLKKDDDIYNEDAVEVFLDADGDGATYNELQVSPHNTNFDASFVTRRSDLPTAMAWESGMKSAVQVKGSLDDASDTDERWTVELQIPIAKLNHVPHVPPVKGDVWRFNAYRLEHLVRLKQIEGQSFSPLFAGDFHHLPRFGKLVFE